MELGSTVLIGFCRLNRYIGFSTGSGSSRILLGGTSLVLGLADDPH